MTTRVALVLGTTSGGTGAHVRMLAAGLAARGIAVSVAGPMSAGVRFGFSQLRGVAFAPVEIGDRPSPRDVVAVLRLRAVLRRPAHTVDVVHAHGLRAGAFSLLALAAVRGERRPVLVVTVHNAPPAGPGAAAVVYQVLERLVGRGADLVLCVSPDLERRMLATGARRVDRAVVPVPDPDPDPSAPEAAETDPANAVAASIGAAAGPPVVLAAGRLVAQKGFGTLLEAAARWRDLDPRPRLLIAGEGPLAGELRARAVSLGVDATFLGQRDDVPALLAAATVFVLPSRWEGQPLVLQEALRAGAAIVATRVGGVDGLTGEDAALLVPPDDPVRLAAAVRAVLTDRSLAGRLRTAARARAAKLPSEADAVTAVLAAYAAASTRRRDHERKGAS